MIGNIVRGLKTTGKQRVQRLRLALSTFIACQCLGCAWHNEKSDFVFWPARLKLSGTNQNLVEISSAPLLFEGGRQWSIAIGRIRRRAMFSVEDLPGEQPPQLRPVGFLGSNVIYPHPPEFFARDYCGAQCSVGCEANSVSIGWGSSIRFTPEDNKAYVLTFDSASPGRSRLVDNPLIETIVSLTNDLIDLSPK